MFKRSNQISPLKSQIHRKHKESPRSLLSVLYNADKCPTSFSQSQGDQSSIIECDYMDRRYMKKVTSNGTVSLHQRYIYRGYLQIACVDLTRSGHPALWYITWDPTEPVATRPLAIQKNATWYTYSHDLTKNVTELYQSDGLIATTYDYSPYGAATAEGTAQTLQWSSEYHDPELALTYYNYRHYNPTDGRWINRNPIQEGGGFNLYGFVLNSPLMKSDILGHMPGELGVTGLLVGRQERNNILAFAREKCKEDAKSHKICLKCCFVVLCTGKDASNTQRAITVLKGASACDKSCMEARYDYAMLRPDEKTLHSTCPDFLTLMESFIEP